MIVLLIIASVVAGVTVYAIVGTAIAHWMSNHSQDYHFDDTERGFIVALWPLIVIACGSYIGFRAFFRRPAALGTWLGNAPERRTQRKASLKEDIAERDKTIARLEKDLGMR